MISHIHIHNFKAHANTDLDIAPLTIMTGINGMGKSSVTQALLLLRDSATDSSYPGRLSLKSRAVNIGGQSGPLVNWFVGNDDNPDMMHIIIDSDGNCGSLDFRFQYTLDNATSLKAYPGFSNPDKELLAPHPLFNDRFQYLSAFRIGPQASYGTDTDALEHRQVSADMGDGAYAVAVLERYGSDPTAIPEAILPDPASGKTDNSLKAQTALWLDRISPRIQVTVNSDGDRHTLGYTYPRTKGLRGSVTALNTGFGVSYVLPIIVGLLSTVPGGLVIIENPEAHIHPAAQSALMELISRVVKGGAQVILETHSDHIIFGALVNMKRSTLKKTDVSILHFDSPSYDGILSVTPVSIGPDCRIKNAPPHFVEQMNLDLDVLFDE